ncbi:hypothetical protein L195_g042054 [Trifolium pratense]|uniref:Uncharacterized protein n=1 Tax=Trifolium pratense TaxID=57577 RepID=A0A2K3M5D1_TRIPR|nr:hypothetical protein L195_g050478 [Trifolium pratense]PNX85979.1 hypothetical protein L195_g042054 [Trifolium pratense]
MPSSTQPRAPPLACTAHLHHDLHLQVEPIFTMSFIFTLAHLHHELHLQA